jgi:cell division protein ZapA
VANEITVDLAGQSLTIRSEEDGEYVRKLAAVVDRKIREVSKGQQGVTTLTLALTAAMAIADDLEKLKEAGKATDGEIDRVSSRIEAELEQTGSD